MREGSEPKPDRKRGSQDLTLDPAAKCDDQIAKDVGKQLHAWRKASRRSQRDIAEASGIEVSALRRVERGGDAPMTLLVRLAAALGKSLRDLVRSSDAAGARPRPVVPEGRAITPELLARLDEKGFREQVLLPLFHAMPFDGVEYTHGGILEQGADFVLWERGLTGARDPIAIVVKAGAIGGATTGEATTATTTASQIRACLTRTFRDPSQHTDRGASRCWVFASGEITKEAHRTFESQLDEHHRSRVTYHNGTKVMSLVNQYLGEASALALLEEAARRLTPAAPSGYAVSTVAGSGGMLGVALHAQPGADPLTFSVNLTATGDSKEERAKFKAAVDALRYGGTVESGDGVMIEFTPPAIFSSLHPAGEGMESLRLEARPHPKLELLALRAVRNGEVLAELPHLFAMSTRTGEFSLRFKVEDAREPLALTIDMSSDAGSFSLRLRRDGDWDVDAVRLLASLELVEHLKQSDSLHVVDDRRSVVLLTAPYSHDPSVSANPVHEIVRAAATIQLVTNRVFPFPREGLSGERAYAVLELGRLLAGQAVGVSVSDISIALPMTVALAESMLGSTGEPEAAALRYTERAAYSVFDDGDPVRLPVETVIVGAKLADASATELREWTNSVNLDPESQSPIAGNPDSTQSKSLLVRLVPAGESITVIRRLLDRGGKTETAPSTSAGVNSHPPDSVDAALSDRRAE